MPNKADSPRAVLAGMKPGTEVIVELRDGTGVAGALRKVDAGEATIEEHQSGEPITVATADVDDVIEIVSTEGLE